MSEILRGRDCVVLFKGDTHPVTVDSAMVTNGWPGGQGVQWADSTVDVTLVTYARGLYGGFLVWGSDETADRFVSMTRNQVVYASALMLAGGNLISTSTYERYTYASRVGLGPLVPLVYHVNDPLYFSLRGFWTKEDELTIIADPMAPAFFTGFVAQEPKSNNGFFLGIQTSL